MTDDTLLPFIFRALGGRKITAAFDGGRLSSDGGVMLLAAASRRMGIAERLAAAIPDRRDPTRIVHPLSRILLARILAIACGYEDADDLDTLRTDPALKLACGHLPESGAALASQPTVSRLENTPTLRDLIRRCCQTNQNSLKKPYPRRLSYSPLVGQIWWRVKLLSGAAGRVEQYSKRRRLGSDPGGRCGVVDDYRRSSTLQCQPWPASRFPKHAGRRIRI